MNESYSSFEEAPREKRGRVVRMALVYSLVTGACAAFGTVAVINLLRGDGGFIVMLVVFSFIGLLTGYQARQYLRDLSLAPVAVDGPVLRKWHKGNLFIFFMPSYYIMVGPKIFSVRQVEYAMILEDDDIRVHCYPHSLVVERIERYDAPSKRYVPATDGA